MNKDAVAAAAVGFTLGLIVALFLWIGPRLIKKQNQQQVSLTTNGQSQAAKIAITSPSANEVVKTKVVKINGSAPSGNLIVITSPVQEAITKPNADGSFGSSITLEEGENVLTISAYTEFGDISDYQTLSLIYTSENL